MASFHQNALNKQQFKIWTVFRVCFILSRLILWDKYEVNGPISNCIVSPPMTESELYQKSVLFTCKEYLYFILTSHMWNRSANYKRSYRAEMVPSTDEWTDILTDRQRNRWADRRGWKRCNYIQFLVKRIMMSNCLTESAMPCLIQIMKYYEIFIRYICIIKVPSACS